MTDLQVFTINTRSSDPATYWRDFRRLVDLTDAVGLDGILCFSANETLADPWIAAQYIAMTSPRLVPIVAVNPVYMHPFTAARMVASIAYMHDRQVILNLITGTSMRDRQVLQDGADHAARYDRLGEYADIVRQLLQNSQPFNHQGRFYQMQDAVLAPQPAATLQPGFLVAGHSDASARLVRDTGAVHLRMLDPQLAQGLPPADGGWGVHLGLIARDSDDAAWAAAQDRFPPDPELEGILDFVMEGNDSVWKRKLYEQISNAGPAQPGYWLAPFGQLRADCPYLVGSHEYLATVIARHARAGARWIILDLPPDEAEFAYAARVMQRVGEMLAPAAIPG